MNYHPDDFIALSVVVETEGGSLLPEPCLGEEFRLKVPDFRGKKKWHTYRTCHCDLSAKMEIPYDPSEPISMVLPEDIVVTEHPGEKDEPKLARVCAVDDAVGLWPRYNDVVTKRSYQA
jgi:hypothetical protein